MTVRAKFAVGVVKKVFGNREQGQIAEEIEMYAVYSGDPNSENHRFWTATPSGRVLMTISNPGAWDTFTVGQEFYVDFAPAPAKEPAAV